MTYADEQGFALLSALAVTHSGWTYIHQGKVAEGTDLMQRGIALFRATGARLTETYLLASCVDAGVRASLFEPSSHLLEEAFTFIEESGERYFEAELHRLKGETMVILKPVDAESHFQQALEIAREQGARSLELRTAMSLARLWLSQSRPEPARKLLYDVYTAFTEGFDTRDLCEARALLAAINN